MSIAPDSEKHCRATAYKWWLLVFLFVTFFLERCARQVYNATLPQSRWGQTLRNH